MTYEQKFKGFISMIDATAATRVGTVIVRSPRDLGDTYEELVESLERLAKAGLVLRIVPRN